MADAQIAVNDMPDVQIAVIDQQDTQIALAVPGIQGEGVPDGGTTGQLLAKASGDDYDLEWINPNPGDITGVTAGTGLTGGGTSGDVTLSLDAALDDLSDVDVTTTPPSDGEALVWDATASEWVPGSAGATAAGSANEIQYNDGASGLAASADLTWDDSAKELGVGGDINLDDGGTYSTTVQVVTPTANRTISFPDATGTVALVGGSSGQLVYNNAGAYAGAPSTSVGATGNITLSLAGAASTPPVSLTGTWFSGGTSTTTKPQLLIEPTGATSTAWNTSGTGLGVNAASGFSGRLIDLQVNGTSVFEVPVTGAVMKYTTLETNCYMQIKGSSAARATFGVGNLLGFFGTESSHPVQLRSGNITRLTIEQSGGLTVADANDIAVGTTTGTKIGTATTQKLGFYNATPVVQPTAVSDITTTATSGSLPTPDGTVTIADATTPTVTELLEYCVELEAKLEAALGHLRTLGLIAT